MYVRTVTDFESFLSDNSSVSVQDKTNAAHSNIYFMFEKFKRRFVMEYDSEQVLHFFINTLLYIFLYKYKPLSEVLIVHRV